MGNVHTGAYTLLIEENPFEKGFSQREPVPSVLRTSPHTVGSHPQTPFLKLSV